MPPPAEGIASRLFLGPALRTQPDRRLVTLVREGYETAFEEIVRRYGRPLGRYAASIVGGRSEDVTQDAFSKALLALRRDDAEIELRPWLFRIVRNTALNDLRDSPPSPEVLAEAIAGGRNPAEELERREELTDLMRRLRALPEPQRAAIVMRELEGLGHEEIAAALGLSGGAARQAIYRARQALRDGAGMLIPLPLLQALLAGGGSGVAETAGAAGMSAAGVGGAAGAGVALKATAATVLVVGAVGAGVALKENPPGGNAKAAPARVSQSDASPVATEPAATGQDSGSSQGESEGDDGGRHHGHGSGKAEPGDDRGGHGETGLGDDHGGESELVDDHRGRGGRGEAEPGDDRGGHDGSSGRHGGGSDSGEDDKSGSSGHGGGSGSGGSGHGGSSGSGHGGGSGSDDPSGSGGGSGSGHDDLSGSSDGSGGGGAGPSDEPSLEDDSSGSGSGSDDGSGSGSGGGSGSSGSSSGESSSAPLETSP
jgi:RNA polymerase sigma factor (sigma-70 family)